MLYAKASQLHEASPDVWPVLLLEDIDLSPAGEKSGTRYTENSQLLVGFLMNLADDVSMCGVGTSQRFPIVLTGNNLALLHGPLTRPGRMDIFTWLPSDAERTMMITSILHKYLGDTFDASSVKTLAKRYSTAPISAFAAAANSCHADRAYQLAAELGSIQIARIREAMKSQTIVLAEVDTALRNILSPESRAAAH
jgi:hypothetical protein